MREKKEYVTPELEIIRVSRNSILTSGTAESESDNGGDYYGASDTG